MINSTHLHQGLTIEKYFDCPEDKFKKCSKIISIQPSFIKVLENFNDNIFDLCVANDSSDNAMLKKALEFI